MDNAFDKKLLHNPIEGDLRCPGGTRTVLDRYRRYLSPGYQTHELAHRSDQFNNPACRVMLANIIIEHRCGDLEVPIATLSQLEPTVLVLAYSLYVQQESLSPYSGSSTSDR